MSRDGRNSLPPLGRAAVAALASALAACVSPQQIPCRSGEQREVEDILYFGALKPNGSVTNEEWAGFLKDVVTPRFPQGLTVLDGSGQWMSPAGSLVRESTHVLQLVHPDDPANDALIASVIAEYKTQFEQESVLRVKVGACVAF